MSSALKESPAAFPRAVGEAGRWAMDGAADRTQLLSVWCQQWNNGVQWRLSQWKTWGSDVGFVSSLSNISPLQSFPQCLTIMVCSRQTVNEGLSPRDRIHTTYTRERKCYWLTKDAHQVHPIRVLRVMFAVNMSMFNIRRIILCYIYHCMVRLLNSTRFFFVEGWCWSSITGLKHCRPLIGQTELLPARHGTSCTNLPFLNS